MLNPRDRSLLLESLRPPEGYRLDYAVGTSFSLDLLALMTVPLAFTFFDWEEDTGEVTADPLALLQAVRQHASQITLFCQAGQINLPPAAQRLTAYLEESVIEVTAPKGGVFHPKVWLLRYVDHAQAVRMRLVCLSRNLTFDRSWDTVLVLDGELIDRQRAFSENNPLAEFFAALPALAIHPLSADRQSRIESLASEVKRVSWDMPEGIDRVDFWPLGLNGKRQWPFHDFERRPMLIMSPFVRDAFLLRLTENASEATLISRPDQLAKLSTATRDQFDRLFAFDPQVETAESDLIDTDSPEGQSVFAGLHAKVFVVDDGWSARVFLGSANATNGAFSGNVEMLIELAGRKKDFGISALLTGDGGTQGGLIALLKEWTAPVDEEAQELQSMEALQHELDELRHVLAKLSLSIAITADVTGQYSMHVTSAQALPELSGATLVCWPTSVRSDRAQEVTGGSVLDLQFPSLPLEMVTGFVAFELRKSGNGQTAACRYVCKGQLSGAPVDRLDRLLACMLSDKDQLLRLIWLLLEAQGVGGLGADTMLTNGMPWKPLPMQGYPIFERIIRATVGDPIRIKELGRLIDDLSRTDEGRAFLPPELLKLWVAVNSAAQGSPQ